MSLAGWSPAYRYLRMKAANNLRQGFPLTERIRFEARRVIQATGTSQRVIESEAYRRIILSPASARAAAIRPP